MTTGTPNRDELALPGLLRRMVDEIKDPQCHYWLYSNYFDVLPPTERRVTRWYRTPLFLDYDALWNPEFAADGMLFDVILKNQLPAERARIKLEYSQIRLIKRAHLGELRRSDTDPNVYYQSEADSIVYQKPEQAVQPHDFENVENENYKE